jgi:DNA-binding NarL/FixJ family response regulator
VGIVEQIRVILVDDHPVFRHGLLRVFTMAPDIKVIGELSDGKEVMETCRQMMPDVIVMDVNLPTQNGLLVTREVKAQLPSINIVILTAYHDEEQLFHAIRSGASAYYSKDVDPNLLLNGIRECHRGNYVINEETMSEAKMAAWLLRQFEERAPTGESSEDMFVPLSGREMEILNFITKGYSNKEVAYHLGISRQTVKNHMTSILRKLDVNDRTQAAVYALRHGWIRLQDTKYDR